MIEKTINIIFNIIDKSGDFFSNLIDKIKGPFKDKSIYATILLIISSAAIPIIFFVFSSSGSINAPLWLAIPVGVLSLITLPFIGLFLYWITKELVESFKILDAKEKNTQKNFVKMYILLLIYTTFFLAYLFSAYFCIASIVSSKLPLASNEDLSSVTSITNTIIVAYTLLTSIIVKFFTDIYVKNMKES